ncbi:MAG: nucleotidyltransferase domain-containing protein [Planctomycetes bacterium]|nr:nucleotidyltransferase domain-containing protein [Planctomycetota bacterium]
MAVRFQMDEAKLAALCRRWKVGKLALFGSAIREDFRPDSDMDLLVTFLPDAPWSALDLVTLQDELRILVGREVDLVEEAGLRNPFRRRRILETMQVVYAG